MVGQAALNQFRQLGKEAGDALASAVDAVEALSETEAGYLDGVTAGTGEASKAVVLDSDGKGTIPDGGSFFIGPAAVPGTAVGGNWLGIEDYGTPPSGTLTNSVAIYAESAGDDLDVLHADGTTDALLT